MGDDQDAKLLRRKVPEDGSGLEVDVSPYEEMKGKETWQTLTARLIT